VKSAGSPDRGASASLSSRVADALKREILDGQIAPGTKLAPLRELAEQFQVSTMTVRQAIERLERDGSVYRIAGVGAFARSADQPRNNGRRVVTLAASDLGSAFEMGIARGIERACRNRNWSLQILDAQHDPQTESQNVSGLATSGSDGAIIIPTWGDDRCLNTFAQLLRRGFPLVVADRIPAGLAADFVESDHELGAFLATQHLLQCGHGRIFMLTPQPMVSSIAARIQGYRRALVTAGITPRSEWMAWLDLDLQADGFRDRVKWHAGCEAILPILRAHRPPLAVFAVDPYTAWGVYEACRTLSLRIPADVSVVGFDDSEISMAMRPPITIVRQRTDQIGRVAVDVLADVLGRATPRPTVPRAYVHRVIDVELVERESVARLAGADSGASGPIAR